MTFQLEGNGPQIYEDVLVPLWFARWAEELIKIAEPKASENVLDVACGTGVTTRMAWQKMNFKGSVTGLDINGPMLQKAADLDSTGSLKWLESDVTKSGLSTCEFDLIICQHGYHYFPDKPAALREFLRVLKPTGRLVFNIWDGHSPYTEALCNAVERHISKEVSEMQRGQRITPLGLDLEHAVMRAGFKDARVIRQEIEIKVPAAEVFVPLHLASMPIAGQFSALPDDKKQRLILDVKDQLSNYAVGEELIYPDAVNVLLADRG